MRTSRADRNYLSYSNNVVQLYAGTDKPEAGQPLPAVGGRVLPLEPQSWDAVLKVCDETKDLHLNQLQVAQGRENAIDCNNRAHDCGFVGDFGVDGGEGDQVITVKGGCHDLLFHGVIHSEGKNADVVCGAWSDQCFDISRDLDFRWLSRSDGKPVTFILARCKNVQLPEGAKVLRLKSFGYSVYWYLKRTAVKVGLFR